MRNQSIQFLSAVIKAGSDDTKWFCKATEEEDLRVKNYSTSGKCLSSNPDYNLKIHTLWTNKDICWFICIMMITFLC